MWRRATRDVDGSSGSALVEAAIVIPFLLVLMLGVFDTGWLLSQLNDVRHAAREGGRQASVNAGDEDFVVARTCEALDDSSNTTVTLTGDSGALGDEIEVTVSRQVGTLTGFTDWAFHPPVDLHSTATFRIEQIPLLWSDVTDEPCP